MRIAQEKETQTIDQTLCHDTKSLLYMKHPLVHGFSLAHYIGGRLIGKSNRANKIQINKTRIFPLNDKANQKHTYILKHSRNWNGFN